MKKELNKVKKNILFIFAIMLFLFIFCFLFYTKIGRNLVNFSPNVEIKGGTDKISQRLAEIIPFWPVSDLEYTVAYQMGKTTNNEIHNDIFLRLAYENTDIKSQKRFNEIISRLYGGNLFIINKNFNVDGSLDCQYMENSLNYECLNKTYFGKIYSVARENEKLNIANNEYFLQEKVIFYTVEGKNYTIYSDADYKQVIANFTADDIKNLTPHDYIMGKYNANSQQYLSKFTIHNNTYRWVSTERITS